MSWHKDDDRHPRRGYHHGNLREALIRAALELIGKKGPAGFTFAEAARAAGVSSAAPYRHYRDLPELMADVALLGFEKFEASLSRAWSNGMPEPVAAFESAGKAYLAFAREEPALYAAMFESGLALEAVPALQQASDRAFAVLRAASEAVAGQIPKESRPPALMLSLHMWAFAHGIASLFARGDGARRKLPMSPDDLLEAGFLIYLQGLGVPPKR